MYLLDTNILSEFTRRVPNPRLLARVEAAGAEDLAASVVSVMELRVGSKRRSDATLFWARIEREILSRVRIEPFDSVAALHAGDILAELERTGQPVGIEDVQIAAIARARSLVMVTANVRHFERIAGLEIEDWTTA